MPITYLLSLALFAMTAIAPAASAYDWRQFNGDAAHSGNNTAETIIGRADVASLTLKFQVTLPDVADGAPAVLQNVATVSGVRDVVFVTTRAGHILALDAQTGATIWSHQNGPAGCLVNRGNYFALVDCYTTSSPAIDPNGLFVYAYGLDGYAHKYAVGDGTEITSGGWPQLTTTKGFDEKGSSALAIAVSKGKSYLYVAQSGYPGDAGDYQGHVTAIELATGAQRVFNTNCSDQPVHFVLAPALPDCNEVQTAIWARPGVIYDAATDRIYMATGNGRFAGTSGYNWGDTVFALNPDGTGANGKPLDSYTPTNFQELDEIDADLGSTAPAILPMPPGSAVPHLAVQGGKDAKLRLIDLDNMSGQGGPGHVGGEIALTDVPQGGEILTQPAVWINPADASTWVFVANPNGLSALRVSSDARPTLVLQWQRSEGGSSPLVANNVLYNADQAILRALEPTTGEVLWKSDAIIGTNHWESPVVANGVVYLSDEQALFTAFALPAASTTSAKTAVIEFYNAALDHYFMTALQSEIDALDAGQPTGWIRTGLTFSAYGATTANANPVCRFYLPPGYGDSHFYSASPAECADVARRFPFFSFESAAVFYIALPDPASGACALGTAPVYRVWNKRADTNHRYTTSRIVRDRMIAAGWVAEGYGNDAVIMCSPQ